jgi:hypothetical protein
MRLAALVLAVCALGAGCSKAQAKAPAVPVALLTPAAPERVIVPIAPPEPVAVEAAVPPAASPSPPRTAPASRPAEPRPPASASPTPPVAAVDPPAAPPVLLQTTSNPAEVQKRAEDLIGVAKRDLDAINLSLLSANARVQYDTARGFVRQAETALGVKNVVLAKELAEKAASLATQLRR